MKRTLSEIKNEAKKRGLGEIDKTTLIQIGIMFAIEDLGEKKNLSNGKN
ncbi:hypothetical protein GW932_00370 [archaeon]|nr:hypothetical protein [archaeon]